MEYLGATDEMKTKCRVVLKPRSRLAGGAVGEQVENPLLLDMLREGGYMGSGREASDRYDAGYSLRNLYFTFKKSASEETLVPKGKTGRYQYEADIQTNADKAEDKYYRIMKRIPPEYHGTIQSLCIDETITGICWPLMVDGQEKVVCNKTAIGEALDELCAAIHWVEKGR